FTVMALAGAQTVTGYTNSIQLSSSGPAVTFIDAATGLPLTGNSYTFTSADHGTHTFMVTYTLVGSRTIQATDSVNSALTRSATVTVTPAAISHFVVSAPSNTQAGSGLLFTVQAFDAFGNLA